MSKERKPISKKLRFEIFKRDKFCCSFCGKSAPDVILEIDHIKPVIEGGKNDILNLTTACFDCNRGKGKRKLSDQTVIKKQLDQLEVLEEKRQQLKLLSKWRDELENLDDEFVKYCEKIFKSVSKANWELNDLGRNNILKLRKKYSDSEIFEVCEISFRQYYHFPKDTKSISQQWNKALNYIPKILSVRKSQSTNPELSDLYYCKAILRNKSGYINEWRVLEYLKSMIAANWEIEEIKQACKNSRDWNDFHRNTSGE